MAQITPASTLENLSRLAAKPGVQSTLILSKIDGSIIRSTGLLAASSISPGESQDTVGDGVTPDGSRDTDASQKSQLQTKNGKGSHVEEIAKMVFAFVTAANDFTEGIDPSDTIKLLRMRTKKNEIVIVPGKHLSSAVRSSF